MSNDCPTWQSQSALQDFETRLFTLLNIARSTLKDFVIMRMGTQYLTSAGPPENELRPADAGQ